MTPPPAGRLITVVALALLVFASGVWLGKKIEITEKEAQTLALRAERAKRNRRASSPNALSEQALRFVDLIELSKADRIPEIEANWSDSSLAYASDALHMLAGRDAELRFEIARILREKTGAEIDLGDTDSWYRQIWATVYEPPADYADFKAEVFRVIDPSFADYFDRERTSHVDLDEVRWGGVRRDGIPPLRQPEMIDAEIADAYLADSSTVFGIEINGDARAYPKRVLAWHEMFVDNVGGVDVAGVYCTLCGTVILYETTVDGTEHALGTSGFLYRSNKLMYDAETRSLWSTLRGTPLIGPLAEAEPPITLPRRAVVTTTWGEWKRRHPDTTALSLRTGFDRNYDEGIAYQDYFATDELMFTVPDEDKRLLNKQEIVALTFPEAGDETLAIDTAFLARNPVYHDSLGNTGFVVLTDPSGASRVYDDGGIRFVSFEGSRSVIDEHGREWTLTERELSHGKQTLGRLASQRAFWFGWRAAFPEVRLIR